MSELCDNCEREFEPANPLREPLARSGKPGICQPCLQACIDSERADHVCMVCMDVLFPADKQ